MLSMTLRMLVIALVVALVGVAPAAARPNKAAVRKAKRLAATAERAYRKGKHEDAVQAYLEAYRLAQAPVLLKNAVKLMALQLADCPRTLEHGQRYLDTGPDRPRAEEVAGFMADCRLAEARRKAAEGSFRDARAEIAAARSLPLAAPTRVRCEQALAELEQAEARQRRVKVHIEARSADPARSLGPVRYELDDATLELSPSGEVELERGEHHLKAQAAEHEAFEQTFLALAGLDLRLELLPSPLPQRAADPAEGRPWPWQRRSGQALLGLAVLGAGAAVWFDVEASRSIDELETVASTGEDRARYESLRSDALSQRDRALWLYAGAGLTALAGTLLWALAPADPPAGDAGPDGAPPAPESSHLRILPAPLAGATGSAWGLSLEGSW